MLRALDWFEAELIFHAVGGILISKQRKIVLRSLPFATSFFVVLLATLLIIRADRAYNQTFDEAAHLACGMEWLSRGTFTYEPLHPPLARVADALVPYLHGTRSRMIPLMYEEGNALLNVDGRYKDNLMLSRLGVLPFFWFSCFLVFRFMRSHFDAWHGLSALVLLALCPPVLAHSGLATTDAALMAMFLWSVLRFAEYLEKPTPGSGFLAGVSLGLACITKFTEIPFFFVAVSLLLLEAWFAAGSTKRTLRGFAIAGIVACLTIWAGYRFSISPLVSSTSVSPATWSKVQTMPRMERVLLTRVQVPASQFFRGISMARSTGRTSRRSFLLGEVYEGGKWDFFPVAVFYKTPISLVILSAGGMVLFFRSRKLKYHRMRLVLLAGLISPILVGMFSKLNIGLRHVLPIFPFLAMLGGVGAVYLWNYRFKWRLLGPAIVCGLFAWNAASSIRAGSDFIPYFNEFASLRTEDVLIDSDLDWGQDLYALEDRLKNVAPNQVYLDYFGDPTIAKHSSSNWNLMTPASRPAGWIAISETNYEMHRPEYKWIAGYPYSKIGHSIRLYHLLLPPA